MQFRTVLTLGLAGTALAACSAPDEDAAAVAEPMPELTQAAVPTTAPDGTPLAAGEWWIEESASVASARFGPADSGALLSLSCDNAARVLTMMVSASPDEGPQTFVLQAGGTAARLDMVPAAEGLPMMSAAIDPAQPVFAGFAQSGAVISIGDADGSSIARIPATSGVSRVLDACR